MGLGTYKQFEKRLFAMKPNIYIGKESWVETIPVWLLASIA